MRGHVHYVAWGGRVERVPATFNLGVAAKTPPGWGNERRWYGLRAALWDAAYGHVNGFPASAIAYYVLTRSLHPRVWAWAFRREQRHGHQDPDLRIDNQGQITYSPTEVAR